MMIYVSGSAQHVMGVQGYLRFVLQQKKWASVGVGYVLVVG